MDSGRPRRGAPHPRAQIRILLADDHPVVRRGLRAVLDREPDLAVTAEADDGETALGVAITGAVDLAVLDVGMPCMSGLRVAAELARRRPAVRSLMLSVHDEERYVQEALMAGARGYVLKTAADDVLVEACRAAMRGDTFLFPDVRASVGAAATRPLTAREAEIVKLIAEGRTNEQIAEALVISHRTVDHHVANILSKLDLHNRVELTRYAIRIGLVEP